jgi:hypothetical protein
MLNSLHIELNESRKPFNPSPIGLDWIICDRDRIAIVEKRAETRGWVARTTSTMRACAVFHRGGYFGESIRS